MPGSIVGFDGFQKDKTLPKPLKFNLKIYCLIKQNTSAFWILQYVTSGREKPIVFSIKTIILNIQVESKKKKKNLASV